MTVWLIIQLLAAFFCVVGPFIMQAKESLHPPMNIPSLGTFGIIIMAAFYFVVAGFINGVIVGGRLGWPWYGTAAVSLAAAAVGAAGSYSLLYPMALKGGTMLTILGGLGLALLLTGNLFIPRLV